MPMRPPLDHCPPHWTRRCYPCPPGPAPQTPVKPPPGDAHNIIYLIDEHDVSKGKLGPNDRQNQKQTLLKRWVWHYDRANLETFNFGEAPDTVCVHEQISNPAKNRCFKWEGYMFDIPGGQATCRVAIAAGAASATDLALSGPVDPKQPPIDRVVGFAGTYMDNAIPLGPVVGVRRDDSYRVLQQGTNAQGVKFAWHCAYYITKETPKKVSGGFPGFFNADAVDGAAQDQQHGQDEDTVEYNSMMNQELDDNATVVDGGFEWGGQMFGMTLADDMKATDEGDAQHVLEAFAGDALTTLGGQ